MSFLIPLVGILIIDQLTKLVFLKYLSYLTLINQGIIFGLETKAPIWIIVLILALILIWAIKTKLQYQLGLGLIFGAGLSNLLDRLLRGGVVDFNLKMTAFNLADLAVVVGVLMVVYWLFRRDERSERDR